MRVVKSGYKCGPDPKQPQNTLCELMLQLLRAAPHRLPANSKSALTEFAAKIESEDKDSFQKLRQFVAGDMTWEDETPTPSCAKIIPATTRWRLRLQQMPSRRSVNASCLLFTFLSAPLWLRHQTCASSSSRKRICARTRRPARHHPRRSSLHGAVLDSPWFSLAMVHSLVRLCVINESTSSVSSFPRRRSPRSRPPDTQSCS